MDQTTHQSCRIFANSVFFVLFVERGERPNGHRLDHLQCLALNGVHR